MRSLTKARSDLGQRGAADAEDRGTKREKAEERRRRRRGREGVAIGRRTRGGGVGNGIDRKGGDELGAVPSMLTFVGMLSAFIRLGGVMFLRRELV